MSDNPSIGITQKLSEFCLELRYDQLASRTIDDAKKAMLDTLGVALLGSTEIPARLLAQTVAIPCARGGVSLWGRPERVGATVAALINGYAAHALDYDDSQHDCGTHMSAPVLPAVLAAAESLHVTGRDLLVAYVAGFETGCRLAKAGRFGITLHHHGIHSTAYLGHFGAAAAAGKLIGLDVYQMQHAFGIVASHAAGLLLSFGTMTKPLHAGNAAQNGLLAAMLAKEGFTGTERAFDGDQNIFSIIGARTDEAQIFDGLGKRFEIEQNTLKGFACAGWRNPIIEALIQLVTAHDLQPSDVKAVNVRVHEEMMRLPNYANPKTGLEGKFSTQHAVAVAIADRAGGLAQFSDARVANPELITLGNRVTAEAGRELAPYETQVRLTTYDGRELRHFVAIPKGDPRNPLSLEDIHLKFRANAASVLPNERAEKAAEAVHAIEKVNDIAEFCELLRPQ